MRMLQAFGNHEEKFLFLLQAIIVASEYNAIAVLAANSPQTSRI
jgi:hypothetical protein